MVGIEHLGRLIQESTLQKCQWRSFLLGLKSCCCGQCQVMDLFLGCACGLWDCCRNLLGLVSHRLPGRALSFTDAFGRSRLFGTLPVCLSATQHPIKPELLPDCSLVCVQCLQLLFQCLHLTAVPPQDSDFLSVTGLLSGSVKRFSGMARSGRDNRKLLCSVSAGLILVFFILYYLVSRAGT